MVNEDRNGRCRAVLNKAFNGLMNQIILVDFAVYIVVSDFDLI